MWGWGADISHSVSQALELFAKRRYGMAICDVNIGNGDGILLAKMLRKIRPSLFVIIATGSLENLDRAHREGFSHCLRKPFELGEFKALVGVYQKIVTEPVNIDSPRRPLYSEPGSEMTDEDCSRTEQEDLSE